MRARGKGPGRGSGAPTRGPRASARAPARVDASARAVKRALRRYDAGSHKVCGAVVAKAHRRHERNLDGLGAQVLRADQLAPLLLAHALTGLRIACRPHEWDFGDAYGEEGAMALFGCGRDDRGGMAGVGVFAGEVVDVPSLKAPGFLKASTASPINSPPLHRAP